MLRRTLGFSLLEQSNVMIAQQRKRFGAIWIGQTAAKDLAAIHDQLDSPVSIVNDVHAINHSGIIAC